MIAITIGLLLPTVLIFPLTLVTPIADFAVLGIVVVGWLLVQLVSLLAWLARQWSGRSAGFVLLTGFGLVFGLVPAARVHFATKLMIARDLTVRSAPVIAAVNAFHAARGHWPERIEELAPEFLPTVPTTGWAMYPDYWLATGDQAAYFQNPWVLEIPMGEILKFDALYYCPETDCEAAVRRIGGGTKRIGKWIFLDE